MRINWSAELQSQQDTPIDVLKQATSNLSGVQATATWELLRQTVMAMIPLLQCHSANQAILQPHTSSVAAAVAAILQRLPPTTPNAVPRRPGVTRSAATAETPLYQPVPAATLVAERSQPQISALSAALCAQTQHHSETSPVAHASSICRPSSAATQHTACTPHQRPATPETEADASRATSQASVLRAQQQNSMTAAVVLKQACLSLLLFLPVAELQPQAQQWLQHAADAPFLLRVFLSTAITHEPDVSAILDHDMLYTCSKCHVSVRENATSLLGATHLHLQ